MDRAVANVAALIPGLLTIAVFAVATFNGIGEIQAHRESTQFHSSPRCSARDSRAANCVQLEAASVEGYIGSSTIVLKVPSEGIIPMPIGSTEILPTAVSSPTAVLWHGRIMEFDSGVERLISADNPDLYTVTWPILLPYGFVLAAFTVIVYMGMSWATGYGFLPGR